MKDETNAPAQVAALLFMALAIVVSPVLTFAAYGSNRGGETDGPLLVIAAPWADLDALIGAAGGRVVGPQSAPMARLATAEDHHQLATALEAEGVWLISRVAALATLCGARTE